MSRLIVVSNRVSIPEEPGGASIGGLTMALSDALTNSGGVWFGWSGKTATGCNAQPTLGHRDGFTVATVDLEAEDVAEYYNGYANTVLWPLFHHRVDLVRYERAFSNGYYRVNARFADAICKLIQPGDVIWVHDYHLFPLGEALRARGVANAIGFFLHIPWPVRDLLTTLPRHEEMVRTLFHYDLIGFQCETWREAFRDYVLNEAQGSAVGADTICAFGRTVQSGVFPIGIDTENFRRIAASYAATVSPGAVDNRQPQSTVIAIDRVDYSKGLEQRFTAFQRLLERHPELTEKVQLLQIGQPSRGDVDTYADLSNRLDAVSGRINSRYATPDWTPIRYLNRSFARNQIAGLYRRARVGLVTPLRDGMNLVAKEYVAAQDPADPGVLVLSRFTGAAAQMKRALIVNPHSTEDVADAILRALTMTREERISRWADLMDGVERDNASRWRNGFLSVLTSITDKPLLVSRREAA